MSRRLLEASCTDSVSPFQNTSQQDLEEIYSRSVCQCVRERTEDERQEKTAPNPRHWCLQQSSVRHLSLLPSSDRRSLSVRRHIAPVSGHVKKRKQSHDLHFQIEVSVWDVGGVNSQRRDLNAAPLRAPRRCIKGSSQRPFPTLESGSRTRGHGSEEKVEDCEQVEAAEERMEKEDGRGLQNLVEADRRHAHRLETM